MEFPIRTTRIAQLAKFAFACLACECLWPGYAAGSIQRQPASTDSTITVAIDRPVEINASRLATVEPHLAADRRDPNHFLAGVILVPKMGDPRDPGFKSESICAALTSFDRSEEHTSELQSPCNLVCRLLLEKKKLLLRPQPSTRAAAS